jgi:hypothetical protein
MDLNEIDRLRTRVDDLEARLEQHFEELNAAVEQRDQFVLGAAWGTVRGLTSAGAFIGVPIALKSWFGWDGWWLGVAGFVGAIIVLVAMAGWNERNQADDEKKMWRLPKWR